MKHLADYVNPYIGTISHILASTRPEVMLPYSMVRATPLVRDNSDYYVNDHVVGYPAGAVQLMPGVDGDFENILDHSREDFRCYYMCLELEEHGIQVETTVTEHVYFHRFTNANQLLIRFPGGKATLEDGVLKAELPASSWRRGSDIIQYVILYFDGEVKLLEEREEAMVLSIPEKVTVTAPISLISYASAENSCALEAQGKSFEEIKDRARDIWDQQLSKILVEGNTEDKKVIFYTALYRSFQRTTDYTEYGRYYSGYDRQVHEGTFYTGDGLWDTWRSMHPLQLLVDTQRHIDILASYNLMYKQSGLMPSFPGISGDSPCMLGFHAASLFADSYVKGIPADYETAYEGIYKNATTQAMMPWVCDHEGDELDQCYYEKGFYPGLAIGEKETNPLADDWEKRQSISVTLEHAYDDFCAGVLAKGLGKTADAEMFMKRSQNYRNLWNPELGFMAPKTIDGNWVEGFDPIYSGGYGGRDYTAENNTCVYTWSVFQDPEGLAELMGGKAAAAEKLDEVFRMRPGNRLKYIFLGQFPDATGLMGQFAMGNEPSFHIPYLYDYFGAPWKTQKKLRDLMDIWFTSGIHGICGDEDGGAMSSWFVFSAMGFYPVCPGKPEYAVGTPLFDKVTVKLGSGKELVIRADGAGDGLRYIQETRLNGKVIEDSLLQHKDLWEGGELVFTMGARPLK